MRFLSVQPFINGKPKVGHMSKISMREQMPEVASFIDSLREAFGKDEIDIQIRKGMRGEPEFFAREIGPHIRTPVTEEVKRHAKN